MELLQSDLRLVESDTSSGDDRKSVGRDTALIEAAKHGESWALETLYTRYGGMVHGILLARVPRDHVDDLLQDVFLQAFNKLGSLRTADAFGGWLGMITRNRAVDFHRRHKQTEELSDTLAERRNVGAEAAEALEAIKSLPDTYRETLIFRLVEGLSGPEIAERTGLTPASVRVNLHRGMKLLRAKLGLEVI